MAPKNKTSFDELRALLGFAFIGLANTILPAVVHAANYLIIPYPRAVVSLIELLPVVAVKLSLPFVIHRIPCRIRPPIVAVFWLVAKKVADDTPPNVMPPIRIAMSVLASAVAAVMEVSCLGMVGRSGTRALAGWGFGTGAGLVINAVWPFVLTRRAGKVLRSATGSAYYLVALLMIAHFFILPRGLTRREDTHRNASDRRDEEETHSFLASGQRRPESSGPRSIRTKLQILRGLLKPSMLPLFAASMLLFLQQGVARTLDGSVFGTFSRFTATYGVSVHLGTLVSRSSVSIYPVRDLKICLISLVVVAVFAFVNAVFLVSTYLAFFLACLTGLSSGLVYINTLAKIMEETVDADDREFSLGVVTAGDAAGMVTGGLFGVLLEVKMCRHLMSARRWCHQSR